MGREGRRVIDVSGKRQKWASVSYRAYIGTLAHIDIDRTETGATQFLYLHSDGTHTWAETMPDAQPADGQVYDLHRTFGDIHLPGNFA